MQTIDNVSRVRIQRRRDSDHDPLHGSAGRVTRHRGPGQQTYRERRSRGALACELRRRGGGLGAAALCGGGGQGSALLLRVPS